MRKPLVVPASDLLKENGLAFPPSELYSRPLYLETMAPGKGWFARFETDQGLAWFPFTGQKLGWKWRLFQVAFCQRYSPVSESGALPFGPAWQDWLTWMGQRRWTGTWPFSFPGPAHPAGLEVKWSPKQNQYLLPGDEALKRWSKNRRQGLKKAPHLQCRPLSVPEFETTFYTIKGDSARNLWRPDPAESRALFRLVQHPAWAPSVRPFAVFEGDTPLNLILLLAHQNRDHYLFSMSGSRGHEAEAMTHFFHHWLHLPQSRDRILDLEGSSLPGVKAFFDSLGAYSEPYGIAWP